MHVIEVDFKSIKNNIIATYSVPAINQYPAFNVELNESSTGSRTFNIIFLDVLTTKCDTPMLYTHPFFISVISPWMDNGVIPSEYEEPVEVPVVDNVVYITDFKSRHV